jgi:probable rRNA maturation factor
LRIEVQRISEGPGVPDERQIRDWIGAALRGRAGRRELTVRLVDEDESARLNREFRGKEGATNVLSFPLEMPPEAGIPYLGDLVLCVPVVRREAADQGKSLNAHYAHMLVHGSLHLLGYDHRSRQQAREMEAVEVGIMKELGFPNPYEAHDQE